MRRGDRAPPRAPPTPCSEADDIYISEIKAAGHYTRIGQAFAVLLPCKSVGVMGDCRTYEKTLALRAVSTTDYMTADFYHLPFELLSKISSRIVNEVRGINRVVYDVTSKPPGTIGASTRRRARRGREERRGGANSRCLLEVALAYNHDARPRSLSDAPFFFVCRVGVNKGYVASMTSIQAAATRCAGARQRYRPEFF